MQFILTARIQKQYYNIDNSKIIDETSILSWGTETTANTKLYYNHNGNPPANLTYPSGTTPTQTAGSNKLYKLNATSNKTGLEFMIKVMAGDKIDIFGKSYYLNTTTVTNGNSTALDLLGSMTNFLLAPGNPAAGKGISAATLNTMNGGLVPSNFFRGNNSESSTVVPKAYINYIFFDEQFKFSGGGASRVGTSGLVKDHWYEDTQLQNITVPKNGYIFVYVSNESNFDVFFDNLQVIHKPGPILEETHYYPFGLTMSGISSRAAGGIQNKYLYNGKEKQANEFSDGSGLEVYDFGFRIQDSQTGRFWQVDPLSATMQNISPYSFAANNPIKFIDMLGLFPENSTGSNVVSTTYVDKNKRVIDVVDDGKTDIIQFDDIDVDNWNGTRENLQSRKGGRLIGHTIYWYDFMYLNERDGTLDKPMKGVSIDNGIAFAVSRLNRILKYNKIQDFWIVYGSGLLLLQQINVDWSSFLFREDELSMHMLTALHALAILASDSRSGGDYDIKVSLLEANQGYLFSMEGGLPIYTTGRALGNILFGMNMNSINDITIFVKISIV